MDALTLSTFLSPILTVTTVWNTGETGEIYKRCNLKYSIVCLPKLCLSSLLITYNTLYFISLKKFVLEDKIVKSELGESLVNLS